MTQRARPVDDVPVATDAGFDEADDEAVGFNWRPRISVDPNVVFGKPTVTGTRLAVEFILGLFAAGWSAEMVLESYPGLTRDDLRAVFAYAQSLAQERQERPRWMTEGSDDSPTHLAP
jgi:uncharacterized protein (DUF433 family)